MNGSTLSSKDRFVDWGTDEDPKPVAVLLTKNEETSIFHGIPMS